MPDLAALKAAIEAEPRLDAMVREGRNAEIVAFLNQQDVDSPETRLRVVTRTELQVAVESALAELRPAQVC